MGSAAPTSVTPAVKALFGERMGLRPCLMLWGIISCSIPSQEGVCVSYILLCIYFLRLSVFLSGFPLSV